MFQSFHGRIKLSAIVVLMLALGLTATALAGATFGALTGPIPVGVTPSGDLTYQWTVDVTSMSAPDEIVCLEYTTDIASGDFCDPSGAAFGAVAPCSCIGPDCASGVGVWSCDVDLPAAAGEVTWVLGTWAASGGSLCGNEITIAACAVSPLANCTQEAWVDGPYAEQEGAAIHITWNTAGDHTFLGFNIYRNTSAVGPEQQINTTLIPTVAQGQGCTCNCWGDYLWCDQQNLISGVTYYYWLEAPDDQRNVLEYYGPVSVEYVEPAAVMLGSISAVPATASLPWLWVAAGSCMALALSRLKRHS